MLLYINWKCNQTLMMFPKIRILRIVIYNRVTLSTDNTILHLVKKFIFCPTQWMNYTTDVSSTMYLNTEEKNNNQNLSVCLNTPNVDPKFTNENLHNSLSRKKKLNSIYLINDEAAKKFVALIKDDLLKNMSYVIELNPGFGLITKELLQAGIPFIHLYESNVEYSEHLNNLCKKFPNQLSLNILNSWNMSRLLSHVTINNDNKLLSDRQEKKWKDESCAQIIGATTKSGLMRNLVTNVVFQTNIMMYGRCIFYLAIPMSICRKATHSKRSTAFYIMFNTLFNFKIFGTLDRKVFKPQYRIKNAKNTDLLRNDDCLFTIIKLEPKSDLFTLFKSRKNLIYFWHFVRHNFYKPSTKVIPALEKIIPGCGVKLIAQNYNIFTEFGDLTPTQTYNLFLELQSWPGFEQSTFLLSANDIKNLYDPYSEE